MVAFNVNSQPLKEEVILLSQAFKHLFLKTQTFCFASKIFASKSAGIILPL